MNAEKQENGLTERAKQLPERIRDFYADVRGEMKKVTWPARPEVLGTTVVVIVSVFFFGAYLFVVDYLLQQGYTWVWNYFKG
jgi:preprotein translocase subunit SecE